MYNGSPERNITYKWKDATEHILWAKLRLTTLWVSGLLPSLSGHSYITLMAVWPVKGCMLGLHLRIFLRTACLCEQISFLCPYIVSGQYSLQFRKLFFFTVLSSSRMSHIQSCSYRDTKVTPSERTLVAFRHTSASGCQGEWHKQPWERTRTGLETRDPPPPCLEIWSCLVFSRETCSLPQSEETFCSAAVSKSGLTAFR